MTEQPSFSITVLEQLRAGGYRPGAWLGMLSASWIQARATARIHPNLVQDWWRLAGTLGTATLGYTAYTAYRHGRSVAWKSAIPLAVATLMENGDHYVHLGLHRRENGELYPHLGPAMTLTALRGWAGLGIGSRWLVGAPITDDEALVGLTMMLVSDITDGWLARRLNLSSALGSYLDGEADVIAWTALTVTQAQHRWLPAWFLGVHGIRWGLPLTLGFGRTFAMARPALLSHSRMGKVAGASQALLAATAICSSLRRDKPDAQFWRRIQKSLLVGTCAVLAATTVQHVASILRPSQRIQASDMVSS